MHTMKIPYLIGLRNTMGSSIVPCCCCSRWVDFKAMDDTSIPAPALKRMYDRGAVSRTKLNDLRKPVPLTAPGYGETEVSDVLKIAYSV